MKNNVVALLMTALAVSLSGISAEERADAKGKGKGKGGSHPDAETVFAAIDTNADGKITMKELGDSKRFQNAEPKELAIAFKQKDLNADSGISLHEFSKSFSPGTGNHGERDRRGAKGGEGKGKGKSKGKG